ncbi:uncharacterized protein F5147DRAFT_780537 [Suillus discolor]|uniref:Uncharacterized protein n=1 Tax=Suillus discolor TaxID=1912936 RepID=A0A9P7ET83_9AGAM|nr:uncharacterized protein F5147DRAFT_780537 [Suillus discolor]KAG2089744.1 hypothetical protein F5147DRAFT_780537 [Suillus discolor]
MTSSEQANAALNDTLKDVQSLIKQCMKLKAGDSATALALSDEIARRLAKDLKHYGESATSFSPQLLSCAAVVQQYSKGGMFKSSLDWTTVGNNDPCIKDHPCFHKTMNYRAPTGSKTTEPDLASLAQTDVQEAVLSSLSLDGPEGSRMADIQSDAPAKLLPSTEKPQHTISSETFATMAPHSPPPTLTKALEPLTPLPISMAPAKTPEKTVLKGDPKTWEKTHKQRRNDKKRQVEDNVADETDMIHRPSLRPLSRQLKRKKKFMSDEEEENQAHGTIYVAQKQHTSSSTASAVATGLSAMPSDPVGDEGFWDVDTRPARWGRDSTIATEAEYSIHHHPRKCDKCVKLDIPCIVLPDKKYGFTRLACANCDEMKITCTIDGVGVWERLQAKTKSTETSVHPPAKHSKTVTHSNRSVMWNPKRGVVR